MKQLKKLGLLAIVLIVASLSIVACSQKDEPQNKELTEKELIGTAWYADTYQTEMKGNEPKLVITKKAHIYKFHKEGKLYIDTDGDPWHYILNGHLLFIGKRDYLIKRFTGEELELVNIAEPNSTHNKIILRKIR